MVALLAATLASGSANAAEPRLKVLGTDPILDGPPAADVTYLAVGKVGDGLEVRVGLKALFPVQNSYPEAGIEWTFSIGGRTFVAEGHPDPGDAHFTLYEVQGGAFNQLAILDGSFEPDAGYMRVWIPLGEIGATRGTRISGVGPSGTEDVDIHQHAGPAAPVVDSMATVKDYVVR
jgi:hypothetical protein